MRQSTKELKALPSQRRVGRGLYSRDAQGNVLAVYSKQAATNIFSIAEFNIFGSKRIGVVTNPEQLTQPVIDPPTPYSFEKGMKQYEFSNHLGNVLSTFTDRKLAQDDFRYDPQPNGDYEYHPDGNFYYYVGAGNGNFIQSPYPDGFIDYYTAQITSATDYYPFGMAIPDRNFVGGYRYGFNSMEKDDEIKGSGNSYDFGARLYDPRVGRWLAVDPLAGKYPSLAPYSFVDNCPIVFVDPDGKDSRITINKHDEGGGVITLQSSVYIYGENIENAARAANDHFKTLNDKQTYYDDQGNQWTIVFDIVFVASNELTELLNNGNQINREIIENAVPGYQKGDNVIGIGSKAIYENNNSPGQLGLAEVGGIKGAIWTSDGKNIIHEAFHTLGFADRYTGCCTSNKGFENDVMGALGSTMTSLHVVHFINIGDRFLDDYNNWMFEWQKENNPSTYSYSGKPWDKYANPDKQFKDPEKMITQQKERESMYQENQNNDQGN